MTSPRQKKKKLLALKKLQDSQGEGIVDGLFGAVNAVVEAVRAAEHLFDKTEAAVNEVTDVVDKASKKVKAKLPTKEELKPALLVLDEDKD